MTFSVAGSRTQVSPSFALQQSWGPPILHPSPCGTHCLHWPYTQSSGVPV